ncbi:MAG: hypothetical protein WC876_00460, partial [Candidatus Thermoplasmatota archaeon]
PSITSTQAFWGHADGGQPAMLLDLSIHNPLAVETRVERVSYLAIVDYVLAGQGVQTPALSISAGRDTTVPVAIPLKDAFVGEWWSGVASGRTASAVHVSGVLTLRGPGGVHELPFKWDSSGDYEILGPIADAMESCSDAAVGLCLRGTDVKWDSHDVQATLHVRNQGPEPAVIRGGGADLEFDEWVVAAGNTNRSLALAPGEEGDVILALVFSRPSMAEWWPGHVERCETTPVQVAVRLDVERPGQDQVNGTVDPASPGGDSGAQDVGKLQWRFPVDPFQTRLICGDAP